MAELRANAFISARALEFLILTATRTGEVIGATWNEIDLPEKTGTIPAARMKAGKEHRVPLPDRAIELLEGLPRETGNSNVFIGGKAGKALSNMACLELLRGMRPDYVPHGFRATFRTWAAETTQYPHIVAELALGHAQSDKLMQAYQRGDLLDTRRRLMKDWAKYCNERLSEANNVIDLGREACP
jgi:integrase